MIRVEDCRLIGRIGRTHGHAGALKLELLPGTDTNLDIEEPVFLLLEGKPVPFFMTELNEAAHPPILHFEDLEDEASARSLCGAEVWAPKNRVEAETEWTAEELVGCTAWNRNEQLGAVTGVLESGLQELLCIDNKGREILVPLQDELIREYDPVSKKLVLELPEGLLELE